MLQNSAFDELVSFPALTQEPSIDGQPPHVVLLPGKDADPDTVPLAPPECWAADAQPFAGLFPPRHVLASDYHAELPAADRWAEAARRQIVRTSPLYESVDHVTDFFPDETLIDDKQHRSKEPQQPIAEGEGPSFLEALGVSAADFLIRSVTKDEPTRVSLSRSMIQMFQAVKGDKQQIDDLAKEISDYPETIQELRARQETRKRIRQNQQIGKQVEEAFKAAFGAGYGLTVQRCPVGSDYTIEPENDYLDEAGHETILGVGKFFVEIKATVADHVRMTEVQGQKARQEAERFVLCVVPLGNHDDPIGPETIMSRARFVTDIGGRLRSLVEAVESLAQSKRSIVEEPGPIELEMKGETVRYKIGHEVWEGGISFNEAVRRFQGESDSPPARAQ
jgi:hypothetical protein